MNDVFTGTVRYLWPLLGELPHFSDLASEVFDLRYILILYTFTVHTYKQKIKVKMNFNKFGKGNNPVREDDITVVRLSWSNSRPVAAMKAKHLAEEVACD